MRSLLIAAALLATAPLGAQQAAFHVADYHLRLDFFPKAGATIKAAAELAVVRRARADTLVLDLLDLKVTRVFLYGGKGESAFTQDSAHVRILVGDIHDDTIRVLIEYGGAVKDGLIIGTDSAGRWMAFSDNWPNRARHWIPSIDDPREKSTVTFDISAPSNVEAIANGKLVGGFMAASADVLTPNGLVSSEPRSAWSWRESHPIPVYLFAIAVAPLARTIIGESGCGFARDARCVEQFVWTAPEQRRSMPGDFKYSLDIVNFFSHLIAPFPYEKLWHLQSSTRFGGMENASAIFYADGPFRKAGTRASTIAHETAHQWFGDAVTEREWSNLWLSEGFATYFEELWTRHAFGDTAFQREMAGTRTQLLRDPVVAARPVIDSGQTDLMKLLDANSYQKGGWTLHMLRTLVGDSAFFRGIRTYFGRHEDGNVMTDDLMAAMEETSGMKLQWFFDQWLRRPGFASLATSWRYDAASHRVVLDVEQGVRFAPYRFPLTVDITDDAGGVHRVRVEIAAEHSVRVTLPLDLGAPPRAIVLDPAVELLAEFHVR